MSIGDHVPGAWLGKEILGSYEAGRTTADEVRGQAEQFRAGGNPELADAMIKALEARG